MMLVQSYPSSSGPAGERPGTATPKCWRLIRFWPEPETDLTKLNHLSALLTENKIKFSGLRADNLYAQESMQGAPIPQRLNWQFFVPRYEEHRVMELLKPNYVVPVPSVEKEAHEIARAGLDPEALEAAILEIARKAVRDA